MLFRKKILLLNKSSRFFYSSFKNILVTFKPYMDFSKSFNVFPVKEKPLLTENEKSLFDLLKSYVQEEGLKSTLRVAGGWVRDKVKKPFL